MAAKMESKKPRMTIAILLTVVTVAVSLPTIASIQAGLPVLARTGNTSTYVSAAGTLISGHCLSIDANGNAIDAGSACSSGSAQLHAINFVVDGGGAVVATGDTKTYLTVDYACTINKATISADQSGSVTVDVWKASAAIPTSANKISASAPVTLSSAQLNQNSPLTGWTTAVSVGDVFGFSVATSATVTRVMGQLWCQ